MVRIRCALACVAFVLVARPAMGAKFFERASVDLASTGVVGADGIGTNAISVAWDGTNAYLGGWNAGTEFRDNSVVRLNSVLTSPTVGPRLNTIIFQGTGTGFSHLDYKAGVGLATAYTNNSTIMLSVYAAGTTTANFTRSIAPGASVPPAGLAFDAPSRSNGLGYLYQSSAFVRNIDATTGTDATSLNSGAAAVFRDIDYDASGNLFARVNNNVVRVTRASSTAFSAGPATIADLTDKNVIAENIAVIEGFAGGPLFAIYNDRSSTSTSQTLASVVRGVRADGTAEALSFLNADGTAPVDFAQAGGIYDFAYDAPSQTLALLDFSANRLYVFTAPEPATIAAVAAAAAMGLRRHRRRR